MVTFFAHSIDTADYLNLDISFLVCTLPGNSLFNGGDVLRQF